MQLLDLPDDLLGEITSHLVRCRCLHNALPCGTVTCDLVRLARRSVRLAHPRLRAAMDVRNACLMIRADTEVVHEANIDTSALTRVNCQCLCPNAFELLGPTCILAHLTELTLALPCEDLSPLAACRELRFLSTLGTRAKVGRRIVDLSPLTACLKLRHIDLVWTPTSKRAALASTWAEQMPALRTLIIPAATQIHDVPRTPRLHHLYMDASGFSPMAMAELGALVGLRKLVLTDLEACQSLDALAACTRLINLEVRGAGALNQVSSLPPSLRSLDVSYAPSLVDVSFLSRCTQLTRLVLIGTGIERLPPGLVNLVDLNASDSNLMDISGLRDCTNLTRLDLSLCDHLPEGVGVLLT
jgi:hypothetical protein